MSPGERSYTTSWDTARSLRRLRELENGNRRLKKLVADLSLDRETLQDGIKRKL